MPLFGQKRSSDRRKVSDIPPPENNRLNSATPTTLPPPPASQPNNAPPAARRNTQSMIPSRRELLFHCQLAHGSATRQIKDFSNVKELYQKIIEVFSLNESDVSCQFNDRDNAFNVGGKIFSVLKCHGINWSLYSELLLKSHKSTHHPLK